MISQRDMWKIITDEAFHRQKKEYKVFTIKPDSVSISVGKDVQEIRCDTYWNRQNPNVMDLINVI